MPASFFAHPHQAFTAGFYRDEDLDFDVRFLLGQAVHGAADVGEVLATIAPIGEKDPEKWFDAWVALGDRVRRLADASAEAGHAVSAAGAYLRAATYFATAVNSVDGLGEDGPLLPTFQTLTQRLYELTIRDSFARDGVDDWQGWWSALAAEPGMSELFAERERRFPDATHDETAPIFDLHIGALRDAGFREVGVIWQRLDDRVLLAVR